MTRGSIIAEALAQAGRSDLTSNARLWLNLFLERAYKVQDWNWLLKKSYGLTVTDGGSVPSDYRAFQNANLIYQSTTLNELVHVGADEWLAFKRGGVCNGAPRYIYTDEEPATMTLNFWPTPQLSYTMDLAYYKMPTLPDNTDASTDSQTPTWPLPNEILIEAVKYKALYYKDDERYRESEAGILKQLMEAKYNSIDRRGGASKLTMGKSYRRRF